MAATKTRTVTHNDASLAGGAGDNAVARSIATSYGATVLLRITNGATAPTVPAAAEIQLGNGTVWFTLTGELIASPDNNGVREWSIPVPRDITDVNIVFKSGDDQTVTIRSEVFEMTGI